MGPTWAFLLLYGSHDMIHTGFRRLTMVNGTPRGSRRHIFILAFIKEKHAFVIVYKVIILIVQGKCTNCTKDVQAYTSHRI